MVLLLAKNFKAGCLSRPNFLKQVVIEIKKNGTPPSKMFKVPPGQIGSGVGGKGPINICMASL